MNIAYPDTYCQSKCQINAMSDMKWQTIILLCVHII